MNRHGAACYIPAVCDDHGLLAAVAAGDETALRTLYERHAAGMLRLLRRLTSDAGTAEEILQESWLAVWHSAGRFRGESQVRSWLLGVARRQAHNRLRRFEPVLVAVEDAPEPADAGAGVEAQVLARHGQAEIMAAIDRLPRQAREVVVLALVDELPYRDIARVLEVPVGTVKSRMSGARARLARMLAKGQVG